MRASSQVLDRIAVTFDDEHAVAAAGLVLPATASQRLGLEDAADELVARDALDRHAQTLNNDADS
ncbi:MAG: hypothetical protein GEU78_17605 [Actinobacteria bacterium]|nr:hypothetical protein [Actinomycetota bacterium]